MHIWWNYFTTRDEAVAEIEAAGMSAVDVDIESATLDGEPHSHDFDALFYILDGVFQVRDEELGITHRFGQGSKVFVPARGLHSEGTSAFRLVAAVPAS